MGLASLHGPVTSSHPCRPAPPITAARPRGPCMATQNPPWSWSTGQVWHMFLFYFHIYKLKQPFSEREGRGCLEEKLGSWALHRVGHLGLFNWETVPYLKGPHGQMASGGRGLLLGAWEMRYLRLPLSRVLLLVNLVIQLRVWDDRIIRKGSVQW